MNKRSKKQKQEKEYGKNQEFVELAPGSTEAPPIDPWDEEKKDSRYSREDDDPEEPIIWVL